MQWNKTKKKQWDKLQSWMFLITYYINLNSYWLHYYCSHLEHLLKQAMKYMYHFDILNTCSIWLISYWKLRDFGMNSRVPWCVLWYYDINLLVLLLNNFHFTVELIQQLDLFCDKFPLLMRCLFLQTIVVSQIEEYRMRFFLKLLYFIDYNHAILKRNGIILWSDKTMAPCVLLIQSRGCEYLGINPIALSVR